MDVAVHGVAGLAAAADDQAVHRRAQLTGLDLRLRVIQLAVLVFQDAGGIDGLDQRRDVIVGHSGDLVATLRVVRGGGILALGALKVSRGAAPWLCKSV